MDAEDAAAAFLEPIRIGRTEAAELIEALRVMIAERVPHEAMERLLSRESGNGSGCRSVIPPLRPCNGGAHSDPFIDNCLSCAPRWGWTGGRVVVR